MKKYIALVLGALLLVFIASNTTYSQQSIIPFLQSWLATEPFKAQLSQIEITYWGQIVSVETRGYFHFVEFLIRKATHFFGFGLMGVLFYLLYRKFKWRFATIFAIMTVFIIACADEWHQTTLVGRTGAFEDVLLDTAGAICLVFFMKITLALFSKNNKNR